MRENTRSKMRPSFLKKTQISILVDIGAPWIIYTVTNHKVTIPIRFTLRLCKFWIRTVIQLKCFKTLENKYIQCEDPSSWSRSTDYLINTVSMMFLSCLKTGISISLEETTRNKKMCPVWSCISWNLIAMIRKYSALWLWIG